MNRSGVTLIELIVAASLIGIGVSVMVYAVRIMNAAVAQKAVVQARTDAQLALIATTREIRNAASFGSVQPCQMTLRVFDFARFGFNNAALFDPTNIGTMTYTYRNVAGARYLERKTEFPNRTDTKNLLTNMLDTCDAGSYMFKGNSANNLPPYDSIEVMFRFRPTFIYSSTFTYSSVAMRRGQAS